MWIISKNQAINTDNVDTIQNVAGAVSARIGERSVFASDAPSDYDKIIEALKNNEKYVEVCNYGRNP